MRKQIASAEVSRAGMRIWEAGAQAGRFREQIRTLGSESEMQDWLRAVSETGAEGVAPLVRGVTQSNQGENTEDCYVELPNEGQ